jgi:hypothetical protein
MNYSIHQSFEIHDHANNFSFKVGEDPDDLGCVSLSSDAAHSMYFEPEMAILVAEALIKVAKTIQEKSKK